MSELLLTGGRVYLRGRFEEAAVLVRDGKIAVAGADAANAADSSVPREDLMGRLLVPGFLDIHTHGGAGVDVNAADAQGFAALSRFFAAQGVTGFLCSVLTDTPENTLRVLAEARRFMSAQSAGARLLGVHLEGPFLSPAYKGAMPEGLLREGDAALFRRYQEAAGGAIRYVTVAPEVPGALALIRAISGEVVVAIGHSGADYETACAAIDAGARAVTHTFNAMGLFHQHRPGIMGAALERDVMCEAICDGRHLHPGAVRMLLACKGCERVVAVTDSIQAAGLPDGRYKLGVNDVVVENGDALLADTRVRAGSTLTARQALQNLAAFTGGDAARVLPLLTENPARLLGLSAKGRIAPGCDADFAVLDDSLDVRAVYVAGRRVFADEAGAQA